MIEQGINVVVGLDLGDQYSHVCVLDLEGHIIVRVRTHVQAFETYFGEWGPMRVVFDHGAGVRVEPEQRREAVEDERRGQIAPFPRRRGNGAGGGPGRDVVEADGA